MLVERVTHFMQLMARQSHLYRPSSFWFQACEQMALEFSQSGFSHFRQQPLPLSYFVPTYGFPGHGLSKAQCDGILDIGQAEDSSDKQLATISHFMSGEAQALADYRVLKASLASCANTSASVLPLERFSESTVGHPIEHFEFDGNRYSRSSLNYLLGLAFASQYIDFKSINTVLEVGGGFGTLGEILYGASSSVQYIDIDIPPTLLAAEYYLSTALLKTPDENDGNREYQKFTESLDVIGKQEVIDIKLLDRLTLLPSWTIDKLRGKIDLFVNFISFQEMEPNIVENYFYHVNRLDTDWILLRNMREGKQQKTQFSVGVNQPIFKETYISMLPEFELVDANVTPFGYKTVDGFHSELLLFRRK